MRLVVALLVFLTPSFAATADLARALAEISLDPAECYRIRDVTIVKEDARFYLTDGYLIFGKAVAGARISAVFTADVEGGDAEVLLMPPSRSERASLASYTGSPNMEEHFTEAIFIFSDDSHRALLARMAENPFNKKSEEMGVLLADRWNTVARNISTSFETRLVLDLLSPARGPGFFTAALHGRKLGNFDVSYDPQAQEQMVVGQIAYRETRPY